MTAVKARCAKCKDPISDESIRKGGSCPRCWKRRNKKRTEQQPKES